MGLVRLAVTDSAITFLWVIYIAFMRPAAVLIASLLELGPGKHELLLVMALLGLNNFLFGWLGVAMGGALWNPAPLLAFYSVGASKDTLFTIAARYPAQVHPLNAYQCLCTNAYECV
jgi:aquaporin SIP